MRRRPAKIAQGRISPTGIGVGIAVGAKVVSAILFPFKKSAFHLRKGFLREGSGSLGAVSALRLQWRDRAGISPASTPVRLNLYLARKTIVNHHAVAIED